MGWLSNLFVSQKSADTALGAAISAGDKIFYTEEEKADFNLKVKSWYLDLLASMKPFNVAMRILAVGVFAMWAIHLLASTVVYIFAFFYCDPSAAICSMSAMGQAIEGQMDKHINDNFGTIIMFYFGAAGLNSAIAAVKSK
jgi:hypothetical protein